MFFFVYIEGKQACVCFDVKELARSKHELLNWKLRVDLRESRFAAEIEGIFAEWMNEVLIRKLKRCLEKKFEVQWQTAEKK